MRYLLTICLIVTFTWINGQIDNQVLEERINAIYSGVETSSPIEGISGTCDCIPYFLCRNGTTCTDGCGVIDIRINDGPCEDYFDTCCEPVNVVTEPINPNPIPPDANRARGCGIRNPYGVGFRIKGDSDNETQFGEFPWMVAILREEGIEETQKLTVYQCGGSIIHPQVILTSTHCVNDKTKKYMIRAGEWDSQTTSELFPYQDRQVEKIITHPRYNPVALFNDIALLVLDSPLDIIDNVDTVCLPSQDEILGDTRCFVTGWGKDIFEKEGQYQVILKKVEVPAVPRDLCQAQLRKERVGKYFILDQSFVCAGGESGKDACRGDGGSPLVCPFPNNPDRYFQGGIVAWGIGCGRQDVPGVYANVAMFRNWVDEEMLKLEFNTSHYTY